VLKLILVVIAVEAMVELWKKAAPVEPLKEWLIRVTPFLYSARQQTHLLQCPYCLSVYAGVAGTCLFFYADIAPVRWLIIALAIHRLSNFAHLAMSALRDKQLDMRIQRTRRTP